MLQVLLRVFFIIIVMQEAHRLPVFDVLAEMRGHGAHGVAHVLRVDDQVLVGHHRRVQFRRPFQTQHIVSSGFVLLHTGYHSFPRLSITGPGFFTGLFPRGHG